MATSIVMPQLGESVAEGVIGKWLKTEGDSIEKDEPIVEVITDKVNAEIPSPVAGVLQRITQPEGATVSVGEEIAVIGDAGDQGTQTEETVEDADQPVMAGAGTLPPSGAPPQSHSAQTTSAYAEAQLGVHDGEGASGRERVRSSPLVRRIAEEHGVNLAQIQGTGIGGRVSKQDILSFVEHQQSSGGGAVQTEPQPATRTPTAAPAVLEPMSTPQAPSVPQPSTMPQPTIAQPEIAATPPPVVEPSRPSVKEPVAAEANVEIIPVSPLRKMIAGRMVQSKSTIPHATTLVEVDMTNVVRYREAHKAEFQQREGVPLSYVAFVVKATVEALKEFPMVNAEWAGDNIIVKRDVNINVAVDAPEGLTTPVIHHADERNLAGLSKAIYDLAQRARNKKLTVNDMQGGTFTVNNTGSLGSVASVSIINYPQAGILTANAIVKRPMVIEAEAGDLIAVRSMMNLSFSFDHRLLDGGSASSFVNAVKTKLESFSMDYPIY